MMKKLMTSIIAMLCLILCPVAVFAHPPKTPAVSWNAKTKTLTVKSEHVVSDPAKHYVLAFVVLNNKGQVIETKQYTKQSSAQFFSDSVQLKSVSSGDTVKIRLVCNIMGTNETSITLK